MVGDSSNILGEKRSNELSVIALDQQIAEHKKTNEDRSVLSWAVSQIWSQDSGSLTRLQKLSDDVHEAERKGNSARVSELSQQITGAVKADQDAVGLQGEITHYAGGGLKTAALFFGGGKGGLLSNRGMFGLAATVGLYGADEAKMSDSSSQMMTDFALGGAKGGATKALFQGLGSMPMLESPAAKGIVLGMGSRLIDTTLTASNYKDAGGNFSLEAGLGKTLATATDTRAMMIDATLFTAAHGLSRGANWLTAGAVDARPLYNNIATSASFGLSGGAYNEMNRQVLAGEQIDFSKVATRALLQGGVDMIAGVPGGLNADAQFRSRPIESLKEDGSAIAQRFGFLKETNLRQTATDMFSGTKSTVADMFGGTRTATGDMFAAPKTTGAEPLLAGERYVRPATDGARGSEPITILGGVKPSTTIDADMHLSEPPVERIVDPAGASATSDRIVPVSEKTGTTAPELTTAPDKTGTTAPELTTAPDRTGTTAPEATAPGSEKTATEKTEAAPEATPAKVYTPEEIKAANASIEAKLKGLSGLEPTRPQMRDFAEFLRDHPEADNYTATMYVRNFGNPAMRRMIEGFYKPGFAMQNEMALATPSVREAYERFDSAISKDSNRSVLPHILGGYVKNMIARAGADGPALAQMIEHHARTTFDPVAAKAIDAALGTKYSQFIDKAIAHDRELPLTDKDIEYVRAIALGKSVPGGPPRIAAKFLGIAGPEPTTLVRGPAVTPAELNADGSLKEAAVGPEVRESVAHDPAANEVSPIVMDLLAEARKGAEEAVAKDADLLRTGSNTEKAEAVDKLAAHLGSESARDWFKAWAEEAPNSHISAAGELATPAVKELIEQAPDAVREFLAKNPEELPLSYRFRALSEIATAFEGKPEVAGKVLEIAGSDPTAMRQIGFELSKGFARTQYSQWLENMMKPENSAGLTVDSISGDAAVRRARIFSAFGDTPVGKYLEEYSSVDPENAQKLLQKLPRPDAKVEDNGRGPAKAPPGADLQKLLEQVVQRRIAENIPPNELTGQLNPALLSMEVRLTQMFRRNPDALKALVDYSRTHLDEVNELINMPLTPEAAKIAAARAPKGRPDRNDPAQKAQMDLRRLSMAYSDLVGLVAPKAAEAGPEQGIQNLKDVRAAFNDVILKNAAAKNRPDDMQLRNEAETAERNLNRITDQFLPTNPVARRDAQLRREAIAKQDGNLLPNGPPPDADGNYPTSNRDGGFGGGRDGGRDGARRDGPRDSNREGGRDSGRDAGRKDFSRDSAPRDTATRDGDRTDTTGPKSDATVGDATVGDATLGGATTATTTDGAAIDATRTGATTTLAGEAKAPEPPVTIDSSTTITPPEDLGVNLGIGPESTIAKLRHQDAVQANLDAAVDEGSRDWQRRKGKDRSYDDDDNAGRGKGKPNRGGMRPKDWRRAQNDDFDDQ